MKYCTNCAAQIDAAAEICPRCGVRNTVGTVPPPPSYGQTAVMGPVSQKNTGLAAVLALIFGFFGLWGVGHIYAGKIGKGIGLLVVGIIVAALFWVSVLLTIILVGFIGIVIFGLILFGGWLWQTYDAYQTAKNYNSAALQTGRAPW